MANLRTQLLKIHWISDFIHCVLIFVWWLMWTL